MKSHQRVVHYFIIYSIQTKQSFCVNGCHKKFNEFANLGNSIRSFILRIRSKYRNRGKKYTRIKELICHHAVGEKSSVRGEGSSPGSCSAICMHPRVNKISALHFTRVPGRRAIPCSSCSPGSLLFPINKHIHNIECTWHLSPGYSGVAQN